MSKLKKWIRALAAVQDGMNGVCPNCKGHNLNYGYIELDANNHQGFGAIWCEDCRHAFNLSRVNTDSDKVKSRIVEVLPEDLLAFAY